MCMIIRACSGSLPSALSDGWLYPKNKISMKKTVLLLSLAIAINSNAQNIVPAPATGNMIVTGPPFNLSNKTMIYYSSPSLAKDVDYFKDQLKRKFGLSLTSKLGTAKNSHLPSTIDVSFGPKGWKSGNGDEFYTISAAGNSMLIVAESAEGFFHSIQSILQLIEKKPGGGFEIPATDFNDYPRFKYRGMHLDVARHFFPVSFIKKYIDYVATYKFNTFHWHLTDDQGWRIEIKKYPLLTQVGSCRTQTLVGNYGTNKYDGKKYCGYYTQEQIRDVVKYAADRYITVIPEIEMPGHAVAALASYPYLGCTKGPYKVWETWGVADDVFCAGNDSTYQFIANVLDEVVQLFPSKYIHVGGDECPKERWKQCPVCQKRIKDEGLKDEHALQSYFVQRIEKYLNSKGRKIIGWDEILEGGLAPNATVMSWRGEEGGIAAANQDHDVIMTPGSNCYFDHSQSRNEDSLTIGGYLPLENVYNYEPIPAKLDFLKTKRVLGAQGNMWTEYITNASKIEYMIFPRICALSEVLWTPKNRKNWNDFEKRLPVIFDRLDKEKINYSKAYYDLTATILPTADHDGLLWKLESKNKDSRIMYIPRIAENASLAYDTPVHIIPFDPYAVVYAYSSDRNNKQQGNMISQKFHFNKATGKEITLTNPPSKSYPGDGPFTLVNGVQNEKGFVKSSEFLGFQTDCEAIIDLGKNESCSKVVVHALSRQASWIWQPSRVTVFYSTDGVNYKSLGLTEDFLTANNTNGTMTVNFAPVDARYIKLWIANEGIIPPGNPGAGYEAWLFVDEIEVK